MEDKREHRQRGEQHVTPNPLECSGLWNDQGQERKEAKPDEVSFLVSRLPSPEPTYLHCLGPSQQWMVQDEVTSSPGLVLWKMSSRCVRTEM